MFSCLVFPTESIRLLIVFVMLLFEVLWVVKRDLAALTIGIFLIARDLPDEEREPW